MCSIGEWFVPSLSLVGILVAQLVTRDFDWSSESGCSQAALLFHLFDYTQPAFPSLEMFVLLLMFYKYI